MSLDDMYREDEAQRQMNESHADRERTQEYCRKCSKWHSRFLPHTCEEGNNEHIQE